MKTYFIDKINDKEVSIVANSIRDMDLKALRAWEALRGGTQRLYVHCGHVCTSSGKDEQNVEYIVLNNNHKRTLSSYRIR